MFIRTKYSGYNRRGEQVASGLFLILMEPKHDTAEFPTYRQECGECGKLAWDHTAPLPANVQEISDKLHRVWKYMFAARCQYRLFAGIAAAGRQGESIAVSDGA